MNLHNGHRVIPINNEEILKKENININDFFKNFEQSAKNLMDIKYKIENEINLIMNHMKKWIKKLVNILS